MTEPSLHALRDWLRTGWPYLVILGLGAVLLRRWNFQLEWGQVVLTVAAVGAVYMVIKHIARETIGEWYAKSISPGVSQQRSIVFPRVWTFQPFWTSTFLEATRKETPREPLPFSKLHATDKVLSKLVIEEYATRLRVHRWTIGPLPQIAADSPTRYDWFDLEQSPHWVFRPNSFRENILWAYATEEMNCVLTLSGAWREDASRKHPFFQLTLSIDRGEPEAHDVIFQIALDPGLLDDQRGDLVYVGGQKRKASEVLPYPLREQSWEGESGEVATWPGWRWHWHLRMQTFDKGSWF